MKSDFLLAVTQLATERRLSRDVVLGAIEAALVSAFRKDAPGSQNISVKILPTTGDIVVTIHKMVVESVEDPQNEISLDDAQKIRADAQLGETVDLEETPREAGRIAAQTAKQVVMQRLREAEHDVVFEEYAARLNELLTGVVQKVEPNQVIINLGRTEAILPASESVPSEHYRPGQRLRVLVQEVERGMIKGPRIMVSRAHKNLVRRLFELEVPEIVNGAVVIHGISREPGYRTKVAVEARQEGVDPVGACVGVRGVRIQNIVNELHGEKIDVIPWNSDPNIFIAQALSPAQVTRVEILGEKSALVVVPDGQLSLAIGREGQNARLAAKLTGWRIDIRSNSEVLAAEGERTARGPDQTVAATLVEESPADTIVVQEPEAVAVTAASEPADTVTAPPPGEAPPAETQQPVEAQQEEPAVATTETATEPEAPEEEDIEAALRALEEEEAAALGEQVEEEAEEKEEPQRFDFDEWLQQYQSQNAGSNQGIRFAEDIFPERGRFRGGDRDDRRRRGGSR